MGPIWCYSTRLVDMPWFCMPSLLFSPHHPWNWWSGTWWYHRQTGGHRNAWCTGKVINEDQKQDGAQHRPLETPLVTGNVSELSPSNGYYKLRSVSQEWCDPLDCLFVNAYPLELVDEMIVWYFIESLWEVHYDGITIFSILESLFKHIWGELIVFHMIM